MKSWLTGSIVYNCTSRLMTLRKPLSSKVRTSVSGINGKAKSSIAVIYENSILKKLINRFTGFLDKESHSKKSTFYKTMSLIGSLLNKIAASLHGFLAAQLEYSLIRRLLQDIAAGLKKNPYVLSGLFCSGFFITYGAAALTGRVGGLTAYIILCALFVASFILLLAGEKVVGIISGSVTYKLLCLAVKSILP